MSKASHFPPLAPPEPERQYNLPIFLVVLSACFVGVGIGAAITHCMTAYIGGMF